MGSIRAITDSELRRQNEELRASRARLLSAANAERRQIERELHDGAQQCLIAVAVNLQHLDRMLEERAGTEAERSMLEELRRDVHEALERVRALAYRVYPALLLDRGLADALRSAVSELRIPARVDIEPLERSSSDVEAAVYFSCLDALRALAGTTGSGETTISVRRDTGALELEVTAAAARNPDDAGLTAARDRVAALGGHLTVGSTADGRVCVSARIPEPR